MWYAEIENIVTGERSALIDRHIDRLHEQVHELGKDWRITFQEFEPDD